MLQWGRGLLAAEIDADLRGADLRGTLQWGRGLLAAEMPEELGNTDGEKYRFNGAAAY